MKPETNLMKRKWLLLGWVILSGAFLTACRQETPKPLVPQVTVKLPARAMVADTLDLTGMTAPSRSADLVARVSGYLRTSDFTEGAWVEAGQPLFVIEPEPYEQQLKLAQAVLVMQEAEYQRQQELSKQNATSAANVEKWLSQRDQAAAQVELARINLGYTRVAAPFAGRIGRRLIDPGNLVGPGGTVKLATLEQITPIYVYFSLNERQALHLRELARQRGIDPRERIGKQRVLVGCTTEDGYPHEGTLEFVDQGVSTATGALQMRAGLPNREKALFPGLFVRVRLPGEPREMLVVPNSAIGNDQEGDYVLVADAQEVVLRRAVVKGPLTPQGCAIRSGLGPDERVIVNGLLRARPGAKVSTMTEAEASGAPR